MKLSKNLLNYIKLNFLLDISNKMAKIFTQSYVAKFTVTVNRNKTLFEETLLENLINENIKVNISLFGYYFILNTNEECDENWKVRIQSSEEKDSSSKYILLLIPPQKSMSTDILTIGKVYYNLCDFIETTLVVIPIDCKYKFSNYVYHLRKEVDVEIHDQSSCIHQINRDYWVKEPNGLLVQKVKPIKYNSPKEYREKDEVEVRHKYCTIL